MTFDTEITFDGAELRGPLRAPAQMLADQRYGGHTSVHDETTAEQLGLAGAPIEGPTHFSQIDPLAVRQWGSRWFEQGCVSSHFLNMVTEGDEVRATLAPTSPTSAAIGAAKADGTAVLTGTASIGSADATELDVRRRRLADLPVGPLHIVDQLSIGMTASSPAPATMAFDEHNGDLYPFTLAQKLERITERSSWYVGGDNPWGRPIVPTEMISVLAHKASVQFPVRGPAVGLFIDLEVRYTAGPVFVGHPYLVDHTIVGVGQSRRVESYWTESRITDAVNGDHVATVLLHQGVFTASFAGYPGEP